MPPRTAIRRDPIAEPATSKLEPLSAPTETNPPAADRATPRWLIAMGIVAIASLIAMGVALWLASGSFEELGAELLDLPALAFVLAGTAFAFTRLRGRERTVWGLFALGLTAWLAGDIVSSVSTLLFDADSGASIADVLWLLAYPPVLAGLYVRDREAGRRNNLGLLDTLIVVLAGGVLLWEFGLDGTITASDDTLTQLIDVAYPAFDLGLLWLVIQPAYSRRKFSWSASDTLLAFAFAGIAVMDTIWLATQTELYDWFAAAFLLGIPVAAILRVRRGDAEERAADGSWLGEIMIVLAGACVAAPLFWAAVDAGVSVALIAGAGLVLALLSARLLIALVQNRRLLRASEQRASIDPLTGLANHRTFFDRLDQELLRAQRSSGAVALLMIDIDNFKLFNDLAGHRAGDRVLTEIAAQLRATCRAADVACRIGGDELAVIAPDTNGLEAARLAERIRQAAHQVQVEGGVRHSDVRTSVSIGCSAYPALADSRVELVEQADAALYRSKRHGRDVSRLFDPTEESAGGAKQEIARVRAQLAARESNFRAVFAHALDPMMIANQQAIIIDTNAALQQFIGHSREELVGRSMLDFVDQEHSEEAIAMIAQALESGRVSGRIEVRLASDERRLVELSVSRFSTDHYLTSLRDVTEQTKTSAALAESEEKFKAVFENALDAMYLIDDDGVIRDINPAACRMADRSRAELVGATIESLVDPELAPEMTELREELPRAQAQEGVVQAVDPKGKSRSFEYTSVANVTPGRHLSIVRDITDRGDPSRGEYRRGGPELQLARGIKPNGSRKHG